MNGAGHVDFDRRSDEGRHAECEMRRVFGKCVWGSCSKGEDRKASVKLALRRLVLAGCELLQTAQVWEAGTLAHVVEFNCRAYLQRICFKPWKARWSANGPAQIAALAELRRGVAEVLQRCGAARPLQSSREA